LRRRRRDDSPAGTFNGRDWSIGSLAAAHARSTRAATSASSREGSAAGLYRVQPGRPACGAIRPKRPVRNRPVRRSRAVRLPERVAVRFDGRLRMGIAGDAIWGSWASSAYKSTISSVTHSTAHFPDSSRDRPRRPQHGTVTETGSNCSATQNRCLTHDDGNADGALSAVRIRATSSSGWSTECRPAGPRLPLRVNQPKQLRADLLRAPRPASRTPGLFIEAFPAPDLPTRPIPLHWQTRFSRAPVDLRFAPRHVTIEVEGDSIEFLEDGGFCGSRNSNQAPNRMPRRLGRTSGRCPGGLFVRLEQR
jgi:hypothetical protein